MEAPLPRSHHIHDAPLGISDVRAKKKRCQVSAGSRSSRPAAARSQPASSSFVCLVLMICCSWNEVNERRTSTTMTIILVGRGLMASLPPSLTHSLFSLTFVGTQGLFIRMAPLLAYLCIPPEVELKFWSNCETSCSDKGTVWTAYVG